MKRSLLNFTLSEHYILHHLMKALSTSHLEMKFSYTEKRKDGKAHTPSYIAMDDFLLSWTTKDLKICSTVQC